VPEAAVPGWPEGLRRQLGFRLRELDHPVAEGIDAVDCHRKMTPVGDLEEPSPAGALRRGRFGAVLGKIDGFSDFHWKGVHPPSPLDDRPARSEKKHADTLTFSTGSYNLHRSCTHRVRRVPFHDGP
jgi:hypothetical protein